MKSLARKIALRFFFVIALMVLCLSFFLLAMINWNTRQSKNKEIYNALDVITSAVENGKSLYLAESELPYYITYTIYEQATQEMYGTNDPFIPILPLEDSPVEYTQKDFYTDGDLRILYATSVVNVENTVYVVQISMAMDTDDSNNTFYYYAELILLSFIPLLLISYLASFFIAKHTLRPIVKMTKTAEQITSSKLDTMLEVSNEQNELDALAVTFNTLFANLNSDIHAINAANEAKSAFLSNMSHEIRTPINAVLGLDEMILRTSTEPEIKNYAIEIQSSGKSLLSIVNDILDFSKIEAGKMEILPFEYDLSSTVNDLVNMIASRAEKKGLELIINVDPKVPHCLIGDETRIKQCILNILTNAVKYTEKGKVALSVSYEKNDENSIVLHFEVSDTGIGIKESDIAKLYSPFERIEEIRNRTIEGTGLGMSIVRKLLALMDTKLIVESEYGTGSSFRFFVKQDVISWDEIGDFKTKYKEYINSIEKYHQRFQAPNANILVVDDTEMNLTVIKSLLKKTLVNVDTAISGFETLEKVKEKKYDIIFLDHRMPEMDGIETYERMKVLTGNLNKTTPVIALTANAVSGAKQEYQSIGFNDYLAKPVNSYELEKMMEFYLPPEKIESVAIDNGFEKYFDGELQIPEDSFLKNIKEVDLKEAVVNCGGADVLENVVKDFLISLDSKADAIENYLNEGDLRNYTVLVHALKSSARLIGAMQLSKMAANLEAEGNEGNLIALHELTPALLEKYRSYKENLKAALEEDDNSDKPEISEEELKRAFKDIRELAEAYNYDAIDYIISMLGDYSIPEDYKETVNKIKQLTVAVDRDGILELL